MIEQESGARVELRPPAGRDERGEVGRHNPVDEQDTREDVRVLIDEGVLRAGEQPQRTTREIGVDPLDRYAAGDEAQPDEIGHRAAIGGKERAELALVGAGDVVVGPERGRHDTHAQRIVAERVIEAVHKRAVRPLETEADQLHAVAPLRPGTATDALLQEADRFVAALRVEHVVARRLARRRLIRSVVRCEIERHEPGRRQGRNQGVRDRLATHGAEDDHRCEQPGDGEQDRHIGDAKLLLVRRDHTRDGNRARDDDDLAGFPAPA